MSLRKEFVFKVLGKEASIAELSRQYGISRKTAYKWLRRFKKHGIAGLLDESKKPKRSPTQTAEAMHVEIVRLRQEHPTWGAKKLRVLLLRNFGEQAPCAKTIERVLAKNGLVRRRKWRPRAIARPTEAPKVEVMAPNDLWTVDFKGWWQTGDGVRCDPLTVRDAHSRYVLALKAVPGMSEAHVRPVFEELFKKWGLPLAIQSDNGAPFASVLALGGLTRLSAWWIALGIHVVRSRPGCPQDNGGHERMHVDVQLELQSRTSPSIIEQQTSFDAWSVEFNHVRPHEALGMKTPGEIYRPSPRKYGGVTIAQYPKAWTPHAVGKLGHIDHRQWRVYVSRTLAGHIVAVEETPTEHRVWFCNLLLGAYVHRQNKNVSPIVTPAVDADAATPMTKSDAGVTESQPAT